MSCLSRINGACLSERLSPPELARYARHLLLPGIGTRGQLKLKSARVLVVGAGGLGCPVLQALAGAGIGRISVIDPDAVDHSNLARQWLHGVDDVGRNKALSARDALARLNPFVEVEAHAEPLDEANADALIGAHDVVVDATDDRDVRYLIDDRCAAVDRPWVHAALYRNRFQLAVFWAEYGVRFRDLYPVPGAAPDCAAAGVLGATAAIAGSWQATEVIKLITGSHPVDLGVVVSVDVPGFELSRFRLPGARPVSPDAAAVADAVHHAWSVERVRQAQSIHEPVCWVDLRDPAEAGAGVLPGAVHLAPEAILEGTVPLPQASRICLYCENGLVSGLLADALNASQSVTPVVHLAGGYTAYAAF